MSKEDRVLVVARSAESVMLMEDLLGSTYHVETALTWERASDLVDDFEPHLVIIDQDPADPQQSFDFCRQLKEDWTENEYLSVILIYDHAVERYQKLIEESQADIILPPQNIKKEIARSVFTAIKIKKKEDEANTLYRKLSLTQGIVEELQSTDSLTRLYNLPSITKILKDAFRKAMRFDEPMSILLISIDHFIDMSHRKGPLYCMQVIKQISRVLEDQIRDEDSLGRSWGGEFIAVLPETEWQGAQLVANRIRDAIIDEPFGPKEDPVTITISQGIAAYNPFQSLPQSFEQLLVNAEQNLSKAKQRGPGQIGIHDSSNDHTP